MFLNIFVLYALMKCDICKNDSGVTFLDKPNGTFIRGSKSRHFVCFECQKKLVSKDKILEKLPS